MSEEQIAFHVAYASVDSRNGEDPTAEAEGILRAERVLAASRGFDGDEAVLLIPVTDSEAIVALDADDRLRFDLAVEQLRALFTAAGLALHLGVDDDALETVDAELDDAAVSSEDLAGFGMPDDADAADDESVETDFAMSSVHVAEFSRRGPWGARLMAQLLGVQVDYLEAGDWSAYRYVTDEPRATVAGSSADHPIIEVNVPGDWGGAWVEVTARGGRTGMFWPNAERLTRPVLDIDALAVPESAEVYRRMLTEADGTAEQLLVLAQGDPLDHDAAARACAPEALGGTAGARERVIAFVAAFGVPSALISAVLTQGSSAAADAAAGDAEEPDAGAGGALDLLTAPQRFAPAGWPRTLGGLLVGGIGETFPLTRRETPLARTTAFLRARPRLGAAVGYGELAAGIAAVRARSPLMRGVGVLLVIDAVVDLAVWARRMRSR
ncbi:hypothetical protein [Microbacterium sp. USHLN186]|uniref:hypothetical protein n=1 Tax=Microbacterium sp. USHLN186 TaxID=3081286 RepID=UPI0030159A0C